MNEYVEEDAADARHNTPPTPRPFANPGFQLPTVEALDEISSGRMRYFDVGSSNPWFNVPPGLHFMSEGPSGVFSDIGRTFSREGELGGVDTLDLRVVLAHLDSAAQAIQAELNRRR